VRSASAGHLRSLFYFSKEKKKKKAIKVSLDDFSVTEFTHKIENEVISITLTSLPQYAIEEIYQII
jgi:hypothetical protein